MQDWASAKKGRSLYQIMKTPSSSVLKIHRNAEKWVSALLIQKRTQKIGLNKFLYDANVPGFDTPRCPCERGEQSVLHVLMNCPTYYRLRRTTWREEEKIIEGKIILGSFLKILADPHYARKAAIFMSETGLIGQFRDLPRRQND